MKQQVRIGQFVQVNKRMGYHPLHAMAVITSISDDEIIIRFPGDETGYIVTRRHITEA